MPPASAQAPPGRLLAVGFSQAPLCCAPPVLLLAVGLVGTSCPLVCPPGSWQVSSGDRRAQPASPAQSHRRGSRSLVAGGRVTSPAAPASCDLAPGRPAGGGALSSSPGRGDTGRSKWGDSASCVLIRALCGRSQQPRGSGLCLQTRSRRPCGTAPGPPCPARRSPQGGPALLTRLFLEPRGRHEGGSFSSMACRGQAALLARRLGGTGSSRQGADSRSRARPPPRTLDPSTPQPCALAAAPASRIPRIRSRSPNP